MSKEVRVNVRTLVNASKIRRENRNGREVVIVPSATLVDNIVMNGIRYPPKAIDEAYKSLDQAPAPLGHPTINGQFVSAKSPDGLARGYIGAHNENVRRADGRVYVDKVIDVEVANRSEGGKRVLEAIKNQSPIHTSTGLLARLNAVEGDKDAKFEIDSMVLDHDAILLDEDGAATPEQGVGIFVNASGEQIEVINSAYTEEIDRDISWSIESVIRSVRRKEDASLIDKIKSAIFSALGGSSGLDGDISGAAQNKERTDVDEARFTALNETVEGLAKSIESIGNALKGIADAQEAVAKAEADKAEAARVELANKAVELKLLDEATAKEATAGVLNALLKAAEAAPKTATRIAKGGLTANAQKVDVIDYAPE